MLQLPAYNWTITMTKQLTRLPLTLGLALGFTANAAVTGQWDFNSGDLSATIGSALAYRGDTAATTVFTTASIGGQTANVMMFPKATPSQGYLMTHGMAPNGGGSYVNQWTLIMDIMFTSATDNTWRALLQSNQGNGNDADLWVNRANGLGFGGNYHGTLSLDEWHRIAFVVDASSPTSANNTVSKFIDGALVGVNSGIGRDGTYGLDPTALLFTDNDDETNFGYVNSIQITDAALSASDIGLLGGATAAGIPVIPEPASGLLLGFGLTLLATFGVRPRK
jgi:hypothetical protein